MESYWKVSIKKVAGWIFILERSLWFPERVEDGLKEEIVYPHGKIVEIVQVRDDGGLNWSSDSEEWRKSRQTQEGF